MAKKLLRIIHYQIVATGFLLLVTAIFSYISFGLETKAQPLGVCPTGMIFMSEPTEGEILTGIRALKTVNNFGTSNPTTSVQYRANNNFIGNGAPESGNNIWRFNWNTETFTPGSYQLSAVVSLTYPLTMLGGSNQCATNPLNVMISNNNTSGSGGEGNLIVEVIPSEWAGPTNVVFGFDALAYIQTTTGSAFDVTSSTSFTWTTNIGTVNSQGKHADFFSGPQTGVGELRATATYGAKTSSFTVDISVTNQTSSNYPSSGTNDTSSGDDNSESNDSTTLTPKLIEQLNLSESYFVDLSSGTEGDSRLATCFESKLDQNSYNGLVDGNRLSGDDFSKVRSCFAERRFILPVNIIPVEPKRVSQLSERTDKAVIYPLRNIKSVSTGKDLLEIKGTADPDADVLIYIFSEPLVMTAKSDSSGQWTYVLEDPLEPGDHEIYAVVQNGDEYIRSSAIAFAIAAGESSGANPNGYNLSLQNSPDSSFSTIYIVAGAAVVLAASVILSRFVWFRKKPVAVTGGPDNLSQPFSPVVSQTYSTTTDPQPPSAADATDPSDENPL